MRYAKALAFLLSAVIAVLCFSIPAVAETVRYDEDAAPGIVVSVKSVDYEDGGPLRVSVEVFNFGTKRATDFTLEKAILYFGDYAIDLGGCVKNRKIPVSAKKSYTVKVPAKKVPSGLAVENLSFLRYKVKYTYKIGEQNHTGQQEVEADMFVVEEDDEI